MLPLPPFSFIYIHSPSIRTSIGPSNQTTIWSFTNRIFLLYIGPSDSNRIFLLQLVLRTGPPQHGPSDGYLLSFRNPTECYTTLFRSRSFYFVIVLQLFVHYTVNGGSSVPRGGRVFKLILYFTPVGVYCNFVTIIPRGSA